MRLLLVEDDAMLGRALATGALGMYDTLSSALTLDSGRGPRVTVGFA
ncbi:MAG: hypothetical protein JF615_04705 [Asticcacaulis sp.]|nr:hypothetical protein [Asticcacaulis sp.]